MKGRTQESRWLYIATNVLHLTVDEFYRLRPGLVLDMLTMFNQAHKSPDEHDDL